MKWVLFGSTGFIGRHLIDCLSEDHDIYVVCRDKRRFNIKKNEFNVHLIEWENKKEILLALNASDVVVNLIGEGVANQKWSEKRKKVLYSSRIDYVVKISNLLDEVDIKPLFFINSSALGYYGSSVLNGSENTKNGDDFLSKLCLDWERAVFKLSQKHKIPVCIVRFSIVLGREGGFLDKVKKPFSFFGGGHIGHGDNWISWIHVKDLINMIIKIGVDKRRGIYNALSPNPIKSKYLFKQLGKSLKRPSWLHIPVFLIELIYGREMTRFILSSHQFKAPTMDDFEFLFPTIEDAFEDIF